MIPRHEHPTPGPARAEAARIAAAIPPLETARLHLRAPDIGDFDAYAEIICGPRGVHLGGPLPRDEAWYDFIQLSSCWMLHGHGGWTCIIRETGEIAGFVIVGLEPGDQEPELGFLFRERAEGHGLAFEAARAARAHAFGPLELETLVSYIDPPNTRSIRLAERLGARRDPAAEAILDGKILVYRHRPEVLQ